MNKPNSDAAQPCFKLEISIDTGKGKKKLHDVYLRLKIWNRSP